MMKRLLLTLCVLLLTAPAVATYAQDFECPAGNPDLTIAAGAVGSDLELLNSSLSRYQELCPNVSVSALESPDLVTDRLGLYIQFLGSRSAAVDVYAMDVIWPAILAEHMVDLFEVVPQEVVEQHFPAIVENNIVDGRLVGLPWYTDSGLFYYRTDLLEKYGLDVPATWADLEAAARTIQEGERSEGNSDFWGYVWQGSIGEATTVNGLEWQSSQGGGRIISADGEVQVNNSETIDAIERAAGWIGTISPPTVIGHTPEDSRAIFQAGDAAFMRNWVYAYNLGNSDDSTIAGLFDVGPLPAGEGGAPAATLGGWQLAVSNYSNEQDAAVNLVMFLASYDEQRERAIEGGYNPTIQALYDDPELLSASNLFARLENVFTTTVPRPSTISGSRYNDVSTLYSNAVHSVLRGDEDARIAMDDLEFDLEDLLIELGL